MLIKNNTKMTNEEKMAMLEEMLELEGGSLEPGMDLNSIEEYDSMAKLSLIVMMDEEFGKKLLGEQIQKFHTVKDILDFMES